MPGSSIYNVTHGDRTFTVTVRREGETTWARIDDGPERPVRLAATRGSLRTLQIAGERHEIMAERGDDGIALVVRGVPFLVDVQDARRARLTNVAAGGASGHSRRELKSPMPGLVVRVECEEGSSVAKGTPLVVLQAMKMENELSLPFDGIVKSVAARPGQTVEQGQVLVVLE